jgi:hypothetical protein
MPSLKNEKTGKGRKGGRDSYQAVEVLTKIGVHGTKKHA